MLTEPESMSMFSTTFPKPFVVSQRAYEGTKGMFDRVCGMTGFRLAGYREKMAVFTTKPVPAVQTE